VERVEKAIPAVLAVTLGYVLSKINGTVWLVLGWQIVALCVAYYVVQLPPTAKRLPYQLVRRGPAQPDQLGHTSAAQIKASTDPRQRERLALADEAAERAAELIGFHEFWEAQISGGGRVLRPPDAPVDDSDIAAGKMLNAYHLEHRRKTLALFERLADQGVILVSYWKPHVKRPANLAFIENIAELLDEAAERLRLHNPDLAAWLGERIIDVRSLAADVREQAERPVPDIQRMSVIDDEYQQLNRDVAQRLRRDAKVWLDYYTRNPDWWSDYVRITGEQLLEIVRLYEYTADQLAFLKDQVG
jgi:hypothetical protein